MYLMISWARILGISWFISNRMRSSLIGRVKYRLVCTVSLSETFNKFIRRSVGLFDKISFRTGYGSFNKVSSVLDTVTVVGLGKSRSITAIKIGSVQKVSEVAQFVHNVSFKREYYIKTLQI